MPALVEPHGGVLVDRFVAPSDVAAFQERARFLPRIDLDAREIADLEMIATGASSPLTGFLGFDDYESVVGRMRLADGTVWSLPVTLAVTEEICAALLPGSEAALFGAGRLWGTLEVAEIFDRDPLAEAQAIYGTVDVSHPGVAYLLSRPRWLVGGPVSVLPLPEDLPFAARRLTPRELRSEIAARGWRTAVGFQTRNPIHRAHEHLTKLALEVTDGLVIHPLIGETKNGDVTADVRFRAYEALVANYYPGNRTVLAAFPAAMRYAGPREAIYHAITRKNYGMTHFIVGRDHAGVGKFYSPYAAQEIFDRFSPEEIGITPLKLDATFFCHACDSTASSRTCPHDASHRLDLSGTRVRELLQNGGELPRQFTRPEIAEILREHYRANGNGHGHGNGNGNGNGNGHGSIESGIPTIQTVAAPASTMAAEGRGSLEGGFILWFTGLSGAGKSTLANALRTRLSGERPVEILDGDEVRTFLSAGLGFSREDRDTNIRRIGYVSRLLARNGVVAIAAAISPYCETRREVHRLAVKDGVPFLEVFAHARLDSLIARDVKGLYKKALAGTISHFTGISDPYEPPQHPDVVVETDRETVEESVARILEALRDRGLIESAPPVSAVAATA
jgi:sulfate adenylyltransferase